MNDRFKFRFWDKKEKEYFTCGKIDHKSGITKTYPYRTYEWCLEHKNIIAEQCTGLKDKNGKLIYEGDIILVEDNKCPIEWESENARYNVVGYGEIAYLNYNDIEVIGNIHNNADLLEVGGKWIVV